MTKKTVITIMSLIAFLAIIQSCATYYFRSQYQKVNTLIHQSKNLETKPFLKAHIKNGDICILKDSWQIDSISGLVTGTGIRYDFNRNQLYEGPISISVDSVAIFETNKKLENTETTRTAVLTILTGINAGLTTMCLINPKACFGSCPTFYINEDDNFHYAEAEAFTNAISPSLEYSDIDALDNPPLTQNSFSLTMKNEAQETHCVNSVKLLAFPREQGKRIYHTSSDDFYLCENTYLLSSAIGEEGDIVSWIQKQDSEERFSLADKSNLNSKEEIYLTFEGISHQKELGIIFNFRQTLMSTYLFYSSMGFMGDEVSDIFAFLENNEDLRNRFDATTRMLGGIDIFLFNERNGEWVFQSTLNETGPIAINKQIIPLQTKSSLPTVKLKLVLNRGLWRIDYVALTNIIQKVIPIEIKPKRILNKGKVDLNALKKMNDPELYLISMPGNEYKFEFELPENNSDYELFLYAKGYYLEWMRSSWIKDKNLIKLKQMVDQPQIFLREEAEAYKQYESIMEDQFWGSRIDTKNFSYYEN